MTGATAEQAERAIREALAAGDVNRATTAALRLHGPELLGFVVGMLADRDAANEAFAAFSERLWLSWPRFEWRCSLRTWCYRLIRHAAIDVLRGQRQPGRVELSAAPELVQVAAHVRTETLSILRTATRTQLERLRDELPHEDRALLILRIDRELEWREIALVLDSRVGHDLPEDEQALKRESARLRKRFQIV